MELELLRSSTVADILTAYPQTAELFIEEKTSCIGCYLSRFCTLEDVARVYALDVQKFLLKFQNLTQIPPERITT